MRWLALERKVNNEFVEWILKKAPTRKYKAGVKIHEISFEEVSRALEMLKRENEKLYWLYRLLLEGGVKLAHALELLASWDPNEKVFVEALGKVEEHCK